MIESKDTYIHPQRHPIRPNAAPSLRPRCAPAAHSAPALRAQMLRAARWVLLWLPRTSAPKATLNHPQRHPSRPNAAPSLRPRCAPAAHSAPALRAQMLRAARWVLLWLPRTSAPKATLNHPQRHPSRPNAAPSLRARYARE